MLYLLKQKKKKAAWGMTWTRNTLIMISQPKVRPWKKNRCSFLSFLPCPVSLSDLFQKQMVILVVPVPGFMPVGD